MNVQDYQQGAAIGSAGANAAIDEWENHANGLKRKLRNAHIEAELLAERKLFENAKVEGLRAVISAMEAEIRRSNPNSSLLQKTTRDNISTQRMAEFLAPQGYHYDLKTYNVSKVSP